MGRLKRTIGEYTQDLDGPLLIALGGIHGNEKSGVQALELVFKMLEVEPITNPLFKFRGAMVGLRGNLTALAEGKRFIDRDLNRIWLDSTEQIVDVEEREKRMLERYIDRKVIDWPNPIVVLDLHTTTAAGGIFTFPDRTHLGRQLGKEIGAPVILGLEKNLQGTCVSYFTEKYQNLTSVVFEGGQHQEDASVNRMIAAIVSCLRAIGCVDSEHIAHQHDRILAQYSKGLPKVSQVCHHHHIEAGSQFLMKPGFKNFDPIHTGQILAQDKDGPIKSPCNGRILMPHYQKLGEDGFFIIQALDDE